jgi:hypothetical protein
MGNIREGGSTEEDVRSPRVRDMWGVQGDELRRWCKDALLGRKMQMNSLSIPRTPSPSGISGVPCVLPHPWGSWERWAVQVRAVGTSQDERDSGLFLCLVPSLSGSLSLLTPTAARTRRDA